MSTIIKSTNTFGGKGIQPSLNTQLTYAQYKARVEADGGRIINEARTQALFDFLTENNISTDNFIVGANFGVKEVNGVVYKVYSLDGNDLFSEGLDSVGTQNFRGPYLVNEGSFYSILSDCMADGSVVNSGLIQEKTSILIEDNKNSFVSAFCGSVKPDAVSAMMTINTEPVGHTALYKYTLNDSSTTYTFSYFRRDATPSTGNTGSTSINFGTYMPFKGTSVCVNIKDKNVKGYENGIETIHQQTDLNGIFDSTMIPVKISLNYDVLTGSTIRRNRGKMTEAWVLKNETESTAEVISIRFNNLYL